MPAESAAAPEIRPTTGPLLAWLAVQLAVLTLAASRVPLAAQYPQPAERMAPHLVLGTQVVVASLLFPFLLTSGRGVVQVIAAAMPFQLAAGYLGARSGREMIEPALFVAAWILALGLCNALLRSSRVRASAVAIASLLTLGGGVLRYLRLEFNAAPAPRLAFESALPLTTTLNTLDGSTSRTAGWMLLLTIIFATATALAVRRFRGANHAAASAS
jgi:hypothetical protein